MINVARTSSDWTELFRKLVYWATELEKSDDSSMIEILQMQEVEANNSFSKFIANNYLNWMNNGHDKPILSPDLLSKKVFPLLEKNKPLFFILIDNMRYDQWKTISAELTSLYRIVEDDLYYSILPTATQFSRNSIFAGLMPLTISESRPELWIADDEEEGKNNFEEELLKLHIARKGMNIKWSYTKISTNHDSKKINDRIKALLENDLNILVYNFVDILSHARTEIGVIRDLATDERAYRSLTRSWFIHSSLFELLKTLAAQRVKVIFSTDHGTIRVQNPVKIIGDRKTSSNLRYKMGRSLDYNPSQVFEIKNPEKAMLPKSNISSRYIFAMNNDFLVYQNNFNHFASYYKDTFQHGGISMQEMILPVAYLEPLG
jgi:hypothetical protein